MTTNLKGGTTMTVGELNYVDGVWVKKGPNMAQSPGPFQTQLLFNEAIPISTINRATRVGPPAPIVIEKLVQQMERCDDVNSSTGSLRLSVLSEERLQAAVRLAKRDLQRRRQGSLRNSIEKLEDSPQNLNTTDPHQPDMGSPPKIKQRAGKPKKGAHSGTQVLVYTPQKFSVPQGLGQGLSPPTRDPGPRTSDPEPQLSQEIRRLQKELANYVQRIEQLANRGRVTGEALEPDERRRIEIRRQEQAARSARIIYVLQQQVKEIQEDLDKLRSQNVRHTKKSRAMDRLAAAHRGAVRAMQVFINQLSDPVESRVPTHYKELGQLIRQLSLCSAKVEVGQGSAVPETTLDILQKLETLDSALRKQESPKKGDSVIQTNLPVGQKSSNTKAHSTSPPRGPRGPSAKASGGVSKPAAQRKSLPGRRVAGQPRRTAGSVRAENRRAVLRAGLERLLQIQDLNETKEQDRPEPHTPSKHRHATRPNQIKGAHVRDAGFQQPTVSSRLRENQLPQRESSVPWIPASPHSSPPRRARPGGPEPRCLFSPVKSSTEHPDQLGKETGLDESAPASERKRQAHSETLRQAWLDRMTADRLRELNQLSKEETERINRLRSEVGSPTQWADKAEKAARDKLQPLLERVEQVGESLDRKGPSLRRRLSEQAAKKAVDSADLLSEAVLEELLEDTARNLWAVERGRQAEEEAQGLLQGSTLETMLRRMEEIEKDQEAVRRRFAEISYSDPLYWDKQSGVERSAVGREPVSPQPIRLTKPVVTACRAVDIHLQTPVETGFFSETSTADESRTSLPSPDRVLSARVEKRGGIQLSVPTATLKSVRRYREDYDAYLRLVSHEAVGSFNPWAVADSLADELLSEALADVAAEFQDVCEEYAEAVFTSEFLQPTQSPAASVA